MKIQLRSVLILLLLSATPAFAEWRYVNKNEQLRPQQCSYRLIASDNINTGIVSGARYFTYSSTDFVYQSSTKDIPYPLLILKFEVASLKQSALASLITPENNLEGFNLLMQRPGPYDCEITAVAPYRMVTRRRSAETDEIKFTLRCDDQSQFDGNYYFDLTLGKASLQTDCL